MSSYKMFVNEGEALTTVLVPNLEMGRIEDFDSDEDATQWAREQGFDVVTAYDASKPGPAKYRLVWTAADNEDE